MHQPGRRERTIGDVVGVREGLLALLDDGPRHGYGLKQEFEAATGGAWELNVGQVYGALQKLEAAGAVAFDGEEEGRKRYRLTDEGRSVLRRWLVEEPVPRGLAARDELAMKILLAARTGVPARDVIAAQRDTTMAALQRLTRQKADGESELARLIHLDRLILHCRAELDWLELTERRFDEDAREARAGGALT